MASHKDIFTTVKREIRFEAARASGPGGQNVNKRNTKVTGLWNFSVSKLIGDEAKRLIAQELKGRVLAGRVLAVTSQKNRSQLDNKKDVIDVMARLVAKAVKEEVPRIATKPTLAKKEKRLKKKKLHSKIKTIRRKKGE
jgi:ribosome-associated protein